MTRYKLSMVIPMYNAELYIENCINSILNSQIPKEEYEIIIVNDGSDDQCPKIAEQYAKQYKNINYFTQSNQGQSTARNYGIKESTGEYVWCVDSDDKVDSKQTLQMYQMLCSLDGIDILGIKLQQVTENNEFIRTECEQSLLLHNKIITGREAVLSGYNPSSVCALIVRKGFIIDNGFSFKKGMTHQDVELSLRMMAYAQNVYFTDLQPYKYILHSNSTSQSINVSKKTKYLTDDILVMDSFTNLARTFEKSDKELANKIYELVKNINLGMVLNLYNNRKKWRPLGINKVVLERMKEKRYYPLKGDFGTFKKNILAKMLNVSIFIR